MDIGVDWIRNIHVNENGWSDIGYHWVIRRDGSLERGRSFERIGAHCKGHNRHSIGICLIGGMSKEEKTENNFTRVQFTQLKSLVYFLKEFLPKIKKVTGHREYANKTCPCFEVKEVV